MNIINAGNPSANNMITRQVMQKKRESSATIFDKLNKRTAQLTPRILLIMCSLTTNYSATIFKKLNQSYLNPTIIFKVSQTRHHKHLLIIPSKIQ